MQYVMLDLHFVFFVTYVLHSQSGDDPQEDLRQAWLQAKYENIYFETSFYIFDIPQEIISTLTFLCGLSEH